MRWIRSYFMPMLVGLVLLTFYSLRTVTFRHEQKSFDRVRSAYEEKWPDLLIDLHSAGIDEKAFSIFIRGFKDEAQLEILVKPNNKNRYQIFKTYSICTSSGDLGPKRKEGDRQVPEGFYYISCFNPQSRFHLSLGLNYPNASDKILSDHKNPGGNIMIHGNCVTVGCIPIRDANIRELYILAVEARTAGQLRIPVHIFPCRLTAANMKRLEKKYDDSPALINFWRNLKEGFDHFENLKTLPTIIVAKNGSYLFK